MSNKKQSFGIYLVKWTVISIVAVALFVIFMIIGFAFLNTYVSKKCSYEIEKNYKVKMQGLEDRVEVLELKLMFGDKYDSESIGLSISNFKDDKNEKKSDGVQKP